ncbi:hypothetical protein FS935_08210 [Metabacillus litoralis]|uniref:Uncharacterized protein n=1 Tax=Metabacillus litoralis TaxID=152268 RepID=A0A5C6W6X4_9BACI|nr:hypothetical protein [Metabacillus litoralis]TXC91610.1 hypothetical protein FS935_08210 [Metabacillus litoralis]
MKITVLTLVTLVTFMYNTALSHATSQQYFDFEISLQKWSEVNEIIPRSSTFTVIDIETAKSFNVQRRAGSGHADVQPLTKSDTKVMKEIYDGSWSWHRRAILIVANNMLIPASMHGMPHGAGAIKNGFPGHFCIHFNESTTHRSGKYDISHHIMILKAAGKYEEYIKALTAEQALNVLLVTIKNNDKNLAKEIALSNKDLERELQVINDIEALRWSIDHPIYSDDLLTTIPVELKVYLKNIGSIKVKTNFTMIRTSPISSWKVNIDPLIQLINENK